LPVVKVIVNQIESDRSGREQMLEMETLCDSRVHVGLEAVDVRPFSISGLGHGLVRTPNGSPE